MTQNIAVRYRVKNGEQGVVKVALPSKLDHADIPTIKKHLIRVMPSVTILSWSDDPDNPKADDIIVNEGDK